MKLPRLSDPHIKGIIKNFFENTVAYALPVLLQQFVVNPVIAKQLGAEKNGLFLALIALNYFIVNITASVLVNTRLLRKKEYEEKNIVGDFNVFILAFAIINSIVIIIGTIFYMGVDATVLDVVLSVIVAILFLYQNYIIVQYRAELRFKNILVNSLILCVGYLIGLFILCNLFPYWQIVFIIPYSMTFVYDWLHTDYIKEPVIISPLFNNTLKKYIVLLGSTLLTTLVTYGDRLLLYPLMDGTSVSVLSSAQLIGKMMQMISTPLATFFLAYLVNSQKNMFSLKAKQVVVIVGGVLVIYFFSIVISKPMLKYLYPSWASDSLQYVSLTAANGVLHMIGVITNVVLLKYCHSKWQLVKSGVYLFAYMIFSFSLLKVMGLRGFCIGNIIASTINVFIIIIVLLKKRIIVFTH